MERDNDINVGETDDIFDICDNCEHFNNIHICSYGYLCRRCLADEKMLNRFGG